MRAAVVVFIQQSKLLAISIKFRLKDIQFFSVNALTIACGRRRISDAVCFRRLHVPLMISLTHF